MTTAELILSVLVKYGPAAARAIVAILNKPDPTAADWEKVFQLAETPYETYIKPA